MSNKQNDEIYDNIMDSEQMAGLTDVVEEMLDRSLTMAEWEKLTKWLLQNQLSLIEHCKKLAIDTIKQLDKVVEKP